MPEPGITDPEFNFPTQSARRRRRGAGIGRRLKLPGGFAGFRLTDGRELGAVMGPEAFDGEAGGIPEGDNGAIRDGVYPMAGEQQNHPEDFAPAPPEPRSMDSSKSVLIPIPKPRPVGIGGAGTGRDTASGPRFFDLPLAADGRVDEKALLPRRVYRMPDSAGGGLGRWTNGMFYNYDRKADWNFRSPADLDAYSGATEAPTPEEQRETTLSRVKAGAAAMPAVYLDQATIGGFNRRNSEGVRAVQGDDEVSFRLGNGPVFLTLPDDAAAVLVRNWDRFRPRLSLLSRLFANDLSPEQMRRQVEAEVYKGIPASERAKPPAMALDGTPDVSVDEPYGMERFIAEGRLRAFDRMVAGIRGGATDEETGALIDEFQKAMLPELMGASRFLQEFARDMIPGLNNLRSGIHFWNDLIEIEEEWKEGDIAGLAGNSVLLVLDGLGMIPIVGSAFAPVRSGLKAGARAVGKALPRLDALVAQAQVWKHARQWTNLDNKIDPSRIFGEAFDKLPRKVQGWVRMKTNFAMGAAGNAYMLRLLRRMDPDAADEVFVRFPDELGPGIRGARYYDMAARRATAILVEDIVGWAAKRFGRRWDNFIADLDRFEVKTGREIKKTRQTLRDEHAMANPGTVGDPPIYNIRDVRVFPQQIPLELAIRDAERRLGELVEEGIIDLTTRRMLLDAMIAEGERGTKLVGLFDYAGLFVNLLAAGGHRERSITSKNATEGGSD